MPRPTGKLAESISGTLLRLSEGKYNHARILNCVMPTRSWATDRRMFGDAICSSIRSSTVAARGAIAQEVAHNIAFIQAPGPGSTAITPPPYLQWWNDTQADVQIRQPYAGAWQVLSPDFSPRPSWRANTFHDLHAPLTTPAIAPTLTFLVSWGHLLIGLSLVSGLLVRVSGVFGVALLLTYWTAHMEFPHIESQVNLIIDYHIVYATLMLWLVMVNTGNVYGLDGWIAEQRRTDAGYWAD